MSKKIFGFKTLTDEAVQVIISAVIKRASELEKQVCISVYAAHGSELAFFKMAKAPDLCSQIARDKAYTSACFGVATTDWQSILKDENERVLKGLSGVTRFITFGGGLPIISNGDLLAGIGVSGGSEGHDISCAQSGVDKFQRL